MNRIILLFALALISTLGCKAQSKCDSIFIIKVYDSVTHKPIRREFIQLDYGARYTRAARTNKRGVAKLSVPVKIDWEHNQCLMKINALGYYYRDSIILAPDSHCVQRVYLKPWDKDLKLEF